jgi:glycosyltransferase involved in cell wall biosynthesis
MTVGRPSISILMPVRDAVATLDDALRSIIGQSLDSWELLVIDDGSTDGSLAVLELHASGDPRIRVLTQSRAGIVPALERGRSESQAPLLARMDADDRAHPQRLEAQVSFLTAHPECALCGTHVRYFPRTTVRAGAQRYEDWLNSLHTAQDLERDLWIECPLAHPSITMRGSALDQVGGYRDQGWPEDYDLILRFWSAGLELGVVPRVLHYWREGLNRLSRTDPRYGPDAFREVKLHFLSETLLKGRDGLVIWGAGPVGKAFAQAALRRGVPVRAFVDLDPRKIGQEIHGAPVLPPSQGVLLRESLGVSAVGKTGVREEIRSALRRYGWTEGRDFVAVA